MEWRGHFDGSMGDGDYVHLYGPPLGAVDLGLCHLQVSLR